MKHYFWATICAILSIITTYKLTLIYFYYVAATNNTTAPFAAFITAIPFGFLLFNFSVQFYKRAIHITRHIILAVV
jgi:hypothetical protein